MKESARAARDEIAHNRSVAALKQLAGEDDHNVKELEDLRARRMPADVGSMMEREIMAGILEGLAKRQRVRNFAANLAETDPGRQGAPEQEDPSTFDITPDFLTAEQRQSLVGAGYLSDEEIMEAPRGDLEALPHIGDATVDKLYEAFGLNEVEPDQEDSPLPSAVLDGDTYALLSESGYDTHEAIVEAPDEDLLAIKGIGDAKLREIRKEVG